MVLAVVAGPDASAKERPAAPEFAAILLRTALDACTVDMDEVQIGTTDKDGEVTVAGIEPGPHYLHVRCPGNAEQGFFADLKAGKQLEIKAAAAAPPKPALTGLEAAEAHMQLQQSVQRAVRLRALGRLDDAVGLLRTASQLDPENPDLHRELGITFLMAKDWKSARVEMLEAVHHDPQNADAHSGLAFALEKLGDLDGALKEYRLATNLEPDDSSYREHYLEVLARYSEQQALKQTAKKK